MISVLLESLCIKNHSLSLLTHLRKLRLKESWIIDDADYDDYVEGDFCGIIVAVTTNRDLTLCKLSILCALN